MRLSFWNAEQQHPTQALHTEIRSCSVYSCVNYVDDALGLAVSPRRGRMSVAV